MRRIGLGVLWVLIVSILTAPLVQAAEFQQSSLVSISQRVQDDVYAVGRRIVVSEGVSGTLWFLGGEVNLRGTSKIQRLNGMGESITLSQPVTEDVHLVSPSITIQNSVEGDVVAIAQEFTLAKEAEVKGDVILASRTATINGDIQGQLNIRSRQMNFNGNVNSLLATGETLKLNGNVETEARLSSIKNIQVEDNAQFSGLVQYWSPSGVQSNLQDRETSFEFTPEIQKELTRWDEFWQFNWQWIPWVWSSFIMVLLLFIATPLFERVGHLLRPEHWVEHRYPSAAVLMIGIPALAFLFAISIIGLPVAVILASLYMSGYILIWPVTALSLAFWINDQASLELRRPIIFLVALLMYALLSVFAMSPATQWINIVLFVVVVATFAVALVPRITFVSGQSTEEE